MERNTIGWKTVPAGAAVYCALQQLWMYATFTTPLERGTRTTLTTVVEAGCVLVLLGVTASAVRRAPDRWMRASAGDNALAAGIGALLGALLGLVWAPGVTFPEGPSPEQVLSIPLAALVWAAVAAIAGVAAGAVIRLLRRPRPAAG